MDSYKAALETARNELTQLGRQREWIDERMAQLKKIIEDLAPLVETELAAQIIATATRDDDMTGVIILNMGITDAIKQVFVIYDRLTPLEVRDGLIKLGCDLSKYSNPMATIHSVLKRLEEQEWLTPIEKAGKRAYERIRTNRDNGLLRFVETVSRTHDWLEDMAKSLIGPNNAAQEAIARIAKQADETNVQMAHSLSKVAEQAKNSIQPINPLFGKPGQDDNKVITTDIFSKAEGPPQEKLLMKPKGLSKEKKD